MNSVVSQFLNYAKPYTLKVKIQDVNQVIEKALSVIKKPSPRSDNVVIEKVLCSDLPLIDVDAGTAGSGNFLNIAFNAHRGNAGGRDPDFQDIQDQQW